MLGFAGSAAAYSSLQFAWSFSFAGGRQSIFLLELCLGITILKNR
jgi:hypothetical protein